MDSETAPATVGWSAHAEAVQRLTASYRALAPGDPVRLAKRTTNLFRGRSATTAGLDVSGLAGVIALDIDPATGAATADVQGVCTYEHLVEVTLAHGFIPQVVPQLRTITLGGAVTGLGIESTSFRNGLPHESVLELDVFTGAGEVVTTRPGDELFDAFPNSYGSLGYATRLRIALEPVPARVALRHVRFTDTVALSEAIAEVAAERSYQGLRVDAMDGVAFAPGEYVLTLARWTDELAPVSDYTGQQIYYRSLQHNSHDLLTMHDYLWRWDTDWFWCSRAFGVQRPWLRRLWPKRWRRSDVYMRLVGLDRKHGIVDRLDRRAGRPQQERVVQDIEVPLERLGEFLDWFDEHVGMRPVWLCPLISRGISSGGSWTAYPLEPGRLYVNVGFWGAVPVGEEASHSPTNRAIEAEVHRLGGHKSLYSEAFYDEQTFAELYNTPALDAVRAQVDPDQRLTRLYDKVVTQA